MLPPSTSLSETATFEIEPHADGLLVLHEPDETGVVFCRHDEGRRGERIARSERAGRLGGEQALAGAAVRGQNRGDALGREERAAVQRHGVDAVDQLIDQRRRHRHERLEPLFRLLRPFQVVQFRHAQHRPRFGCGGDLGELLRRSPSRTAASRAAVPA